MPHESNSNGSGAIKRFFFEAAYNDEAIAELMGKQPAHVIEILFGSNFKNAIHECIQGSERAHGLSVLRTESFNINVDSPPDVRHRYFQTQWR